MMLNKNIKAILISIFSSVLLVSYTHAESSTATQRVTVTIPPSRAVYLNQENQIVAAFSNVADIEETGLQVFRNGCEIKADDEILKKYHKLLPEVNWNKIGWVYIKLNPDNRQDKKVASDVKYSANRKNRNKVLSVVFVLKTVWA